VKLKKTELLLPAYPSDVLSNPFMCEQVFHCVVMAAKLFLSRDLVMDLIMAIATQGDRFCHLGAGKVLFEPLVFVTGARNQMVLCRSTFSDSLAKTTRFGG